jgi:hypothetical protein
MQVLAICRPAPGVDPGSAFPPHLSAELDALRSLRTAGVLAQAYSPGGPGAVLLLNAPDLQSARTTVDQLPLAVAGLIETELIPLHPVAL